MYVYEISRYTW